MPGRRVFRWIARSALAPAALVLLSTGRTDARELRDDAARFFMDVSATGGAVCVVHPQGLADEACRDVPPGHFRVAFDARTKFYVIEFPDWEVRVLVGIGENPTHRSLTSDEARALFDGHFRSVAATNPGIEWITDMRRLERGELSTHQRTLAAPVANGRMLERFEIIAGSESLVSICITFPEEHAAGGNNLADAIMSTVSLPPAPPLRTEVAYGALKLLAGVPIIAVLGLLRGRTRQREAKK